jgi:hypothetical protein
VSTSNSPPRSRSYGSSSTDNTPSSRSSRLAASVSRAPRRTRCRPWWRGLLDSGFALGKELRPDVHDALRPRGLLARLLRLLGVR